MIAPYLVVAGRVRQELEDLDRVLRRVERAVAAAQQRPIEHLVQRLGPCFEDAQRELLTFATLLEQLAQDD